MAPRLEVDQWSLGVGAAEVDCGSKLNHQDMDRRFESLVPFTRLLFWLPIFDPQPVGL